MSAKLKRRLGIGGAMLLGAALAIVGCVALDSTDAQGAWPGAWGGGSGSGISTVSTSSPVSGNGTVGTPVTVANGAIALPKLATQATATIVANATGSTASPTAVALGAGLGFLGGNLVNSAPFGADTQVDINNASGTAVHALQVTNSLTTSTAGSEASKWVIKLLSAGAQTTALDLRPAQMLSPDGSVSAPAWAFSSQSGTGFYRDPANASISWANSGTLGGLLKNGVVWIYDSAGVFQIGSGFDTSMRRSANGLELRTFTNGAIVLGVATSNNASFFDAAPGYNSGQNIIALKNRAAAPTGNYATGGYLYAEGGALMWRGSSGTVTTIAPP